MKLFAVYIGGIAPGANIELHDMRFCAGETIEDCYDDLRAQWWGAPESLHLDCWGALESADGYDIALKPEPYAGENRLWFVNLGGYTQSEFTELHKNVFVVALNESKAKVRALKTILDWESHHRDYLYEVEQILCLNDAAQVKGLHIHLLPSGNPKPFAFTCRYRTIGEK
jgi:hypothetical protein